MPENYSNPKITNPIIPPQPSEYIEEDTETVQEPKNDGKEGGGNDKPTPKPDSGKTQPKPEEVPKTDEETHQEEEAPKPEETEPKEEVEDGGHKDEEEGGLEEQNPIEDKDDAQGNFFEDNKGLLTRVYNILKLRFPNSNVSLPQLLTGAQQYIDMIAAPPGGGGQGGGQPTGTGQGQNQAATIKLEDINLDDIIKKYNAINAATSKRLKNAELEKISDEDKKDPRKRNILINAIVDFHNYVVQRSRKNPVDIEENVEILMYIHDYLADTVKCSFNRNKDKLFNCFLQKEADCSGFSYAVVFLCCYINFIHEKKKQDEEQNPFITNPFITIDYVLLYWYNGKKIQKNDKDNHMFNCIKKNDKWYYLDVSQTRVEYEQLNNELDKNDKRSYVYDHRFFMFQDLSFRDDDFNGKGNRKLKAIGIIDAIKDGEKPISNTSDISHSNFFYDFLCDNHELINLDLNLEKLTEEFKTTFSKNFKNYEINISNSKCEFKKNIALLQIKKLLYIAFSFDAQKLDSQNIECTANGMPLFFLFIIWLVEKYKLPSAIEFICINCNTAKKSTESAEKIQTFIEKKYARIQETYNERNKKHSVSCEELTSTNNKEKNYYYSLGINIAAYEILRGEDVSHNRDNDNLKPSGEGLIGGGTKLQF